MFEPKHKKYRGKNRKETLEINQVLVGGCEKYLILQTCPLRSAPLPRLLDKCDCSFETVRFSKPYRNPVYKWKKNMYGFFLLFKPVSLLVVGYYKKKVCVSVQYRILG